MDGIGFLLFRLMNQGIVLLFFVGDFLMIELRSDILRSLERLLHLLGELIDAHN